MSVGGIGSSESLTEQKTLTVDNRNVADGNAVIWNPKNSNNPRTVLKLGKGATYTVNNGIGADALAALQSRIDILGRAIGGPGSDKDAEDKIRASITDRTGEQITDAPGEAKKIGLTNWLLIITGGALLVGVAFLKFKRKK